MRMQLVRFGAHQRTDLEMLLDAIPDNTAVVDFGAHVGTYTIPIARKAKEVIAIEGDGNRFAILLENIEANGLKNVKPRNVLVASEPKHLEINRIRRTGTDHLDPLWSQGTGTESNAIAAADIIAECSNRPGLIKTDLEGMDLEILNALCDTIERHRPVLCAEFRLNSPEADQFETLMFSLGYATFINASPRNSSIFKYMPVPVRALGHTPLKGIYDIFAAPTDSAQAATWRSCTTNPDGLRMAEAFMAHAQGRHPKALKILNASSTKSSNYWFLKAKLFWAAQVYDRAATACGHAVEMYEPTSEGYALLSQCLLAAGQDAAALEAARTAVKINKLDPEAHFRLGLSLGRHGDASKAREAIHQAISIDGERKIFHDALSNLQAAR